MASKSLRAQLNQIRAWVREGRTDAWIAHQLEVSASELRDFRRRHGLSAEEGAENGDDLRDEIEAEVEAATLAAEEEDEEEDEEEPSEDETSEETSEGTSDETSEDEEGDEDRDEGEGERPRRERDRAASERRDDSDGGRRRRRRRRGGRGRRGKRIEASFDHGEEEGYGLWLDPAVKDNPVYAEHWAGHRPVEVTIEPDQIVIRRSGDN